MVYCINYVMKQLRRCNQTNKINQNLKGRVLRQFRRSFLVLMGTNREPNRNPMACDTLLSSSSSSSKQQKYVVLYWGLSFYISKQPDCCLLVTM